MLRSFLLGLAGGMRSMTPLAAVAIAAHDRKLPETDAPIALLGHPAVVAGTVALAAGELIGDKIPSAPDRIVAPGIAARVATGAITGAAVASRDERLAGAALGVLGAVASSYLTFRFRKAGMERYGQVATGLVEDAAMLAAVTSLVRGAQPEGRRALPAH